MGKASITRRLGLHRETVRELNPAEQHGAVAGQISNGCITTWDGTICSGNNCVTYDLCGAIVVGQTTTVLQTLSCTCNPI